MSAERPTIVYVGDSDKGRALALAAAKRDWLVYQPTDTFEALGMVVMYFPDIVVLDMVARPTTAVEVYYHLRTLTGDPVRLILLDRDDQHGRSSAGVTVLPHGVSRRVLLSAVEQALTQAAAPTRSAASASARRAMP